MNEQFSAFLDNECSRDESDSVMNALLRDERLRADWSRQHWLRTILRAHSGEVAVALDTRFSARVMDAIAADERPDTSAARPIEPISRRAPRRRRRWRGMAGVAAVASAAGVVLLVSSPYQRGGDTQTPALTAPGGTAVAETAPTQQTTAGASNPAAVARVADNVVRRGGMSRAAARPAASARQRPADHWSVSDPALEDELNSYLVEHNGLARGYGVAGTTPAFVRVAAYGQEPAR